MSIKKRLLPEKVIQNYFKVLYSFHDRKRELEDLAEAIKVFEEYKKMCSEKEKNMVEKTLSHMRELSELYLKEIHVLTKMAENIGWVIIMEMRLMVDKYGD